MSRRTKKKGMSPAAAAALLLGCASVAWVSLRGQLGGAVADDAPAAQMVDHDPADDVVAESDATEKIGRDLLTEYGSWTPGTPVRMSFTTLIDASATAAPLAETDSNANGRWIGKDPPAITVGVLMVGEASRRAVVNGNVVGLGDKIDRATVVAIERDAIAVTWGNKRLTYGLDSAYPREFQNELQRREAALQKTNGETKAREEGQ